ncbi:hypothetical protein NQZ68_033405 [Dissostichus eleginoides]|nr:hypothetical protein NQZ68_033405 [Dissostichus eleginoides]
MPACLTPLLAANMLKGQDRAGQYRERHRMRVVLSGEREHRDPAHALEIYISGHFVKHQDRPQENAAPS